MEVAKSLLTDDDLKSLQAIVQKLNKPAKRIRRKTHKQKIKSLADQNLKKVFGI